MEDTASYQVISIDYASNTIQTRYQFWAKDDKEAAAHTEKVHGPLARGEFLVHFVEDAIRVT